MTELNIILQELEPGDDVMVKPLNDNFEELRNAIASTYTNVENYAQTVTTLSSNLTLFDNQSGHKGGFCVTDGEDANWLAPSELPFASYINGLKITKESDSSISVTAGSCYNSTYQEILKLTDAVTKTESSLATEATYYVYLYRNGNTTDIDISGSSSVPDETNEAYRQIGSFRTEDGKIKAVYSSSDSSDIEDFFLDEDGTNGYIIYKNGRCEQWGTEEAISQTGKEVTFLVEYRDDKYNALATQILSTAAWGEGSNAFPTNIEKVSSKKIKVMVSVPTGGAYFDWRTIGYIR